MILLHLKDYQKGRSLLRKKILKRKKFGFKHIFFHDWSEWSTVKSHPSGQKSQSRQCFVCKKKQAIWVF